MEIIDISAWSGLLFEALSLIVLAIVAAAARWIGTWARNNATIDAIMAQEELAMIVVNAVEQAYAHLDGPGKLDIAVAKLVKMLKNNNLKVTEEEVHDLIEDAVKTMREEF